MVNAAAEVELLELALDEVLLELALLELILLELTPLELEKEPLLLSPFPPQAARTAAASRDTTNNAAELRLEWVWRITPSGQYY